MNYNIYCDACNIAFDEKKDVIIPYHDKLYHKRCIMEEFEEQEYVDSLPVSK
jgi:hypothetical protein